MDAVIIWLCFAGVAIAAIGMTSYVCLRVIVHMKDIQRQLLKAVLATSSAPNGPALANAMESTEREVREHEQLVERAKLHRPKVGSG